MSTFDDQIRKSAQEIRINPDPNSWHHLRRQLNGRKRRMRIVWLPAAAAVILIFVVFSVIDRGLQMDRVSNLQNMEAYHEASYGLALTAWIDQNRQ